MDSELDSLRALASNHRWSWHVPTRALLERLPGAGPDRHPTEVVRALSDDALESWLADNETQVVELHAELAQLVDDAPTPAIAYFSPEFGVAAELPQYSGGLGILAGDHLKASSDLGLPIVGIGLFYRHGFFRQDIEDAHQQVRYETIEPEAVGAVDTGAVVDVTIEGRTVAARVWRQLVGASQLLLLDTDLPANDVADRAITDRLYAGDRRHRLHQELVLGVGGVRALRALDLPIEVFHLNEGHACFLLLELLAERVDAGESLDDAIEVVRGQTLFTTHTPVPAGIDRFDRSLVEPELELWADRLGVTVGDILTWATLPSDGAKQPFNTAALAFELCGRANGVSQLHAGVSRKLFSDLPRAASVKGITNGVHARTWVGPDLQAVYDRTLGSGWQNGDPEAWARVDELDRDEFSTIRAAGRRSLIDLVAELTGVKLDPDCCVLGFARRFATYKRAALLLRDPAGLEASLEAGAQFVFAGKAHPADRDGQAVLAEIAAFAESSAARGQLVLVPDYDIRIAQAMYGGCNVWLNNPIRPREACGTSGEKAALNGGLNCSILDGWWADWYTEGIGWVIPTSKARAETRRDAEEAVALHHVLNDETLPCFGDPDAWWETTIAMLAHLGPRVTAGRMVAEYDDRYYRPIRRS